MIRENSFMKFQLNILGQWFDNDVAKNNLDNCLDASIDWIRCIPFVGLHIGCFAVFFVGWSVPAIITALILYLVRMFAITGFYHRYFSHRSFKTSRFIQFFFALIGASAVQRGPLWWSSYHRYHHKYSDTKSDIHSPSQSGFWKSHMFWFMGKSNFLTKKELIGDLTKYPELRILDRFDIVIPLLLAVGLIIFGDILYGYKPWKINWSWGFYSSHSTGFFIKTSSAQKVGLYNLKYKYSSDYDYFYRMIVKEKMAGVGTKKDELFGIFRRGGFSSKIRFLDHFYEEIKIRIDNKQNLLLVLFIFIFKYLKHLNKIRR